MASPHGKRGSKGLPGFLSENSRHWTGRARTNLYVKASWEKRALKEPGKKQGTASCRRENLARKASASLPRKRRGHRRPRSRGKQSVQEGKALARKKGGRFLERILSNRDG